MPDKIIAPRRNEPLTKKSGAPTVRFAEYLEATTTMTNDQEAITSVQGPMNEDFETLLWFFSDI